MSQIENPTGVFAFIEPSERTSAEGAFTVSPRDAAQWVCIPADHPERGANLSYVDGHVNPHQWLRPKAHLAWRGAVQDKDDLQDLMSVLNRVTHWDDDFEPLSGA